MPKFKDELIEYRKWKWEFLRRRPEYIESWKNLPNRVKKKYKDFQLVDWDLEEQEVEFMLRWNLFDPIPPYITSDEIAKIDKNLGIFAEEGWNTGPVIATDSLIVIPVMDENGEIDERKIGSGSKRLIEFSEQGTFNVRINLNYSKRRILNEFKLVIDQWMENYEAALKKILPKKVVVIRG